MVRKIIVFVMLWLVWVLLVWPRDAASGAVRTPDLAAGVVVALITTWVMREVAKREFHPWFNPRRYFWPLVYLIVLLYDIIKANLDVAYRVLHPAMPIHPGIVKVRTSLRSPAALTVLSNSITLTPGTLTVNADREGTLYVHWINIKSTDIEEASRQIVGRFEWFLKRIFE